MLACVAILACFTLRKHGFFSKETHELSHALPDLYRLQVDEHYVAGEYCGGLEDKQSTDLLRINLRPNKEVYGELRSGVLSTNPVIISGTWRLYGNEVKVADNSPRLSASDYEGAFYRQDGKTVFRVLEIGRDWANVWILTNVNGPYK